MSKQPFMNPEEFDRFFSLALTDKKFREDIKKRGLAAFESRGFQIEIPKKTRQLIDKNLFSISPVAGGECKVCTVCSLCSLCGQANAASAAAAVTAIIHLGATSEKLLIPKKPSDLGLRDITRPKF